MTSRVLAAIALAFSLVTVSCGYHVAGKADTIPKSVQTVAVMPFKNLTTRYRLTDLIPQSIARELISRSRFRVVNNPESADAILTGLIRSANAYPVIYDPGTGRATVVQVSVVLEVQLKEKSTGKILYSAPPFTVNNNYEIAIVASQYFDEGNMSLYRLGQDIAQTVVSGILENF